MSINYYINQSVLGGTAAPRYADPLVTGAPNQDGLYPWSSFRARLGTITDGAFVPTAGATFTDALRVNLLLFTSDVPLNGQLMETLATGVPINQGFITPALKVGVAGNPAFFKTLPSASADVTVSAGQVGAGYVATGAAAPNNYISATGFPAAATVGVVGTTATFDAQVTANGAVVSSPVSTLNFGALTADAATCGFLPIVLLYSAYTQAIRDAGNVYVATAALSKDVKYQVVGLYSTGIDSPT